MKKVALFLVICTCTLLISGCGKEKTMTCTRTVNQNNIEMSLNYTAKYKGDYVTSLELVDTFKSDDVEYLNTLKSTIEEQYKTYNDIEYYDIDVKIDGNTLTSTTSIDYEKIDTDELIKVDSANKQLIKDGKVSIDDVESVYTNSLGMTCEK